MCTQTLTSIKNEKAYKFINIDKHPIDMRLFIGKAQNQYHKRLKDFFFLFLNGVRL